MKKNKAIWNYLDMSTQVTTIFFVIIILNLIAEKLERFIFRYTIFPLIASILIFIAGILIGRGVERTKKNKPIGYFSKKMAKKNKKNNSFIFSDEAGTYTPNKEIIEEIKSGEIVHVKQFQNNEFECESFDDIYKINIDDIVDDSMEGNGEGKK